MSPTAMHPKDAAEPRVKWGVLGARASSALGVLPLPLWSIWGLAGPASAATLWTLEWYFAEKIQEPVLIVVAGVLGCLLRRIAAP